MMRTNIYFVITIDTEADHTFDWTKSDPLTFRSVTESIPEVLDPMFKQYGAVATYLLTVEVLEDDGAIKALKKIADCELGTHLHPEYIEPEKKFLKYDGAYSTDFSSNYEAGVEREKIINITKLFSERIGYAPRVYRGGKFGFGENAARTLIESGYLIDTSVTPNISWKNINGPDFRGFSEQPYYIKNAHGNGKLLEVPVSITFLNALDKMINRPAWLRPSFSSRHVMKKLIDKITKKYKNENAIVLNMMFHSMEFFPGASPYARDRDSCCRLADSVEFILKYCKELGINFCGLSALCKDHLFDIK